MSSDLSRPISDAELDYARRAQGEMIRSDGMLATYAACLLAALALYFGYVIGGLSGNVWGVLLLVVGAALLAFALRIFLFKNPAATMTFKPLQVSGPFTSRIVKSGNVPRKLFFIGDNQVSYPGHWHATLSRHPGPLLARAALPSWADGTSEHLSALLLEVDGGPSIDFERANSLHKHPVSNPWISLAAVSTGVPALVLLGAYASMAYAKQTDLARSYQSVRAYLLPAATFSDGDELKTSEPPVGRVSIQRAWRMDASSVGNAPPNAMLTVISRAARDRIFAERQETGRTYADAWKRYQQATRDYNEKWPVTFDAFPGPGGTARADATRPPRPQPPLIAKQSVAAGDVIAYVAKSETGRLKAPEGVDPIVAALEKPVPVAGELLTTDKPYLVYPPEATRNWRESGLALAAGAFCLLVFLLFAWLITRDMLHRRAFAADVRAAYAEKRGYELA